MAAFLFNNSKPAFQKGQGHWIEHATPGLLESGGAKALSDSLGVWGILPDKIDRLSDKDFRHFLKVSDVSENSPDENPTENPT